MNTINYMGKNIYQRDNQGKFNSFKTSVKRFCKRVLIAVVVLSAVGGTLYGTYSAGSTFNPKVVTATVTVEVPSTTIAPVLQRIAKCESQDSQVGKDGQVIVHINSDKSYDIGRYQINSVWNGTATKMGLNLYVEKDNETFAEWIYATKGTSDWYSSRSCWSK